MGVSEGAISGPGEECGAGVRPSQLLLGQAGLSGGLRGNLSAGWERMRKSPHSDEESLVDESDVTRFSQKLDNIFKNGT